MKKIQICGDPTLDWLWVKNPDKIDKAGVYFWLSEQAIPKIGLGSQPGGSALIYDLVKRLAGDKAIVQGVTLEDKMLKEPVCDSISSSWTMWQGYEEKGRNKPSFRICEWQGNEPGKWEYEKYRLHGKADLLMIEDSGIGFRDCKEGWPDALTVKEMEAEYLILKLSIYNKTDTKNPLVEKLQELNLCHKTTVVTALNDLRACSVRIGSSLSWEKLFDDIIDAVYNPKCIFCNSKTGELLYDRVIVTIGTAGAVIINRDSNVLIFDRSGQEDDFSHNHEGDLMGYNTCLMGALAMKWLSGKLNSDCTEAVREGVALSRFLNIEGYEIVSDNKRQYLQFPFNQIISMYHQYQLDNTASYPDNIWNLGTYSDGTPGMRGKLERNRWSILEETLKSDCHSNGAIHQGTTGEVCICAKTIIKKGAVSALKNVPIERVGAWTSADRHEIEGIRSVNNAFRNYLTDKAKQETPLCIAVFGPPGSGKSFAIKEIAKGLGIDKSSQITFNMSQFESPDDLITAFHQIRDLQLKGKEPLIFWDEFDTPCQGKLLGWLRYLLAPMQDGEFMENGRSHPIGRGIFVFAGATRHSFSNFCEGSSVEDLAAKKPDFISRLKAYLDIKGPNGNPNTIEDKLFMIRRAFLLNTFLDLYAKKVREKGCFQIEDGVLDAFLRVGEYKYGARSMETLIKMSTIGNKRRYEFSCLPPDQIIGMHVNIEEFIALTKFGQREMMRIGITGHIGLNPEHLDTIQNCVRDAITFIENTYPERYLTVFSPMALGADRLVARLLLERESAALIAVLPVPMDDYINDFGRTDQHNESYPEAEMRQEFRYWIDKRAVEKIVLPPTSTRDEAYLNAGIFAMENCNLLIAVWDGMDAAGKGGTGDIVNRAIALQKPIIHIWAGNYKKDVSKRTDVGLKLGTFRYKNIMGLTDNW